MYLPDAYGWHRNVEVYGLGTRGIFRNVTKQLVLKESSFATSFRTNVPIVSGI